MQSSDDNDTLIKQLTHRDTNTRYRAETQLRRLGVDAVPSLMRALEAEWKRYTHRELFVSKTTKICLAVSTLFICCGCFLIPFGIRLTHALMLLGFFMTTNLVCVMGQAASSRMPRRLKLIYELLLEHSDARMFGRILEMVSEEKAWLTNQALLTLTQHLPQITLLEWGHLTPKQRRAFYKLAEQQGQINTRRCYEFTLAALKALEQFGDKEAIPSVEYLIKHGSNKELRGAAYRCLEYLEVRRDEDSIRQTLLRASQSTSGKDELLKVPTHTPDTESEQLLRMPNQD